MNFVPGLSYGAYTGSLAYPRQRPVPQSLYRADMLVAVLELVHPGQFKALPPSPSAIASKGELMGLAEYCEFFRPIPRF